METKMVRCSDIKVLESLIESNPKIKRIQSANRNISSAISSLETLKLENIDAAQKINDIINILSKNYCDLMSLQQHLRYQGKKILDGEEQRKCKIQR